jgi:hypothetical protein
MTLVSFNVLDGIMAWLGVGNVEGVLLRAAGAASPPRKTLLLREGVVSYQLPPLRTSSLPIMSGDTLVLATDGIRSDFAQGLAWNGSPQQIANGILAQYSRGTDHALALVVRYLGRAV